VEITQALDALAQVIADARPRALGGGAIIDQRRAMELVEEVQRSIPEEIHRANGVMGERDQLISDAALEAEHIKDSARAEAAQLVAQDEVTLAAHAEAGRIIQQALSDADQKRAEIDAYVDGKLAAFEGSLQRVLEQVSHGRMKLAGERFAEEGAEAHEMQPEEVSLR
jgi:cell division septum initiation protein DivIVA